MTVLERFLNYVVVETTSDPYAESFPSTKSQLDFGHTLMEEMKELGLTDVTQDEYGYVFGTIPSTVPDYKGKILPVHGQTQRHSACCFRKEYQTKSY